VTELTQHSFQSERMPKAQIAANQRSINDLRYHTRIILIISNNLDIRRNRIWNGNTHYIINIIPTTNVGMISYI